MLNSLTLPPVVDQLVERVGGRRQMGILGVGLGVVLLILGLARWATSPTWVPVYSDLPLESVSEITTKLDEEAIPYRLENGGAELQVATSDLAKARVALAKDGGLPNAGRPGLELFDQPSWGMTDFTQRINYRRALEGELERTIGHMEGIESAQVHLALEENAGFRQAAQPPEASVVLKLKNGRTPPADVVEGISHLVAGSVDGIDAERVTVLDQGGRLLSSPWEPGSPASMASRELELRSDYETYLEAKAERIVNQIVGAGNGRVQISAEINGDRVERTTETVDPERQVLASEQRSEIIPGAEGGAGSSNVSNNYLNSRTVETYSGAVGNVRRVTAAVLINDRIDPNAPAGAAPVARSPEELARIQSLVQSAIGFDESRGDVVSVVSVPFDPPALEIDEGMDVMTMIQTGWKPGIMLLAIVFAFIFGLRAMRAFNTPPVVVEPIAELAAPQTPGDTPELEPGETPTPTEEIVAQFALPVVDNTPTPGQVLREEVIHRLDTQPEVSLRLIRAWLKDS